MMTLNNFNIVTRPNKWLEPKYARSYYDVFDKNTGKKYRFSNSEIFNMSPAFVNAVGREAATEMVQELTNREDSIQTLKDEYAGLYDVIKQRHDAGMKIPRSWVDKLNDLFDEMYNKDINIGRFGESEEAEVDDSAEAFAANAEKIKQQQAAPARTATSVSTYQPKMINQSFRSPETEAPHMMNMKNLNNQMVEDDDFFEGMQAEKALTKCRFLWGLSKDGDSSTAGPVSISSIGYVNPMYSAPAAKMPRKKKNKFFKG